MVAARFSQVTHAVARLFGREGLAVTVRAADGECFSGPVVAIDEHRDAFLKPVTSVLDGEEKHPSHFVAVDVGEVSLTIPNS